MCKTDGITKTYYYHLRDHLKRPIITVCLLKDASGLVHRGVSICSSKDIPKKVVGRGIAYGRALAAYNRRSSDVEKSVALRYEAIEVVDSVIESDLLPLVDSYIIKSVYNANLTEFEKKLTRT